MRTLGPSKQALRDPNDIGAGKGAGKDASTMPSAEGDTRVETEPGEEDNTVTDSPLGHADQTHDPVKKYASVGNKRAVVAEVFAGVGVVLLYACQFRPASMFLSVSGTALAIAAAAGAVGGFLGFLFGIPRADGDVAGNISQRRYRPNTNLEQVSDWLTKILIGVGLAHFGNVGPALGALVSEQIGRAHV